MADPAGGYRGWAKVAALALAGLVIANIVSLFALPSSVDLPTLAATVRAASTDTLSTGSARMDATIGFSGGSSAVHTSYSAEISGVLSFTNQQADLSTVAGPVSGLEMRVVGGRIYEKTPSPIVSVRHISTPWVSFPLPSGRGIGLGTTGGDPAATLAELQGLSAGTITGAKEVGSEDVRGVATTHYQMQVNLAALQALGSIFQSSQGLNAPVPQLHSAEIDVWIDEKGLIRREAFVSDGSDPTAVGQIQVHVTITIEQYDFGIPVSVQPPPPDQVTNLTNLGSLFNPIATP